MPYGVGYNIANTLYFNTPDYNLSNILNTVKNISKLNTILIDDHLVPDRTRNITQEELAFLSTIPFKDDNGVFIKTYEEWNNDIDKVNLVKLDYVYNIRLIHVGYDMHLNNHYAICRHIIKTNIDEEQKTTVYYTVFVDTKFMNPSYYLEDRRTEQLVNLNTDLIDYILMDEAYSPSNTWLAPYNIIKNDIIYDNESDNDRVEVPYMVFRNALSSVDLLYISCYTYYLSTAIIELGYKEYLTKMIEKYVDLNIHISMDKLVRIVEKGSFSNGPIHKIYDLLRRDMLSRDVLEEGVDANDGN